MRDALAAAGTTDGHGRRAIGRRAAVALAMALLSAGSSLAGVARAATRVPQARRRAGATVAFQPIRELWDANRVARPRNAAAACRHAVSTLQIVTCAEARNENVDVAIDAVRAKAFRASPTAAAKAAINRDDAAWLANRLPVCRAGYAQANGGTIVQILVASCSLAVSQARLAAVQGRHLPTARLTATDNIDPTATQYATTANGTRIGAIDTQGDQTGGVVIAWTIIGGYAGFTVDPAAFTYVDGSFVDPGIVLGHAAGHVVPPGKAYVFDVDYSRLAKDPHARAGRGRFEYRAGTVVVGAWR